MSSLQTIIVALIAAGGIAACGEEDTSISRADAGQADGGSDAAPNDSGGDVVPDGGVCTPGQSEGCYEGPEGTLGVGLCTAGTRECLADGSGFGSCAGQTLPVEESCATPGDDDCDGQVNEDGEDCSCTPGETQNCYSAPAATLGVGPCQAGTQECNASGSGWGPCAGEVVPIAETCATPEDDDCDGAVNEDGAECVCPPGAIEECYSGPPGTAGTGICQSGQRTCDLLGTGWTACTGEVVPMVEDCDTPFDDDCDGTVNEDGAGCACTPGTVELCYDGPAGTLGKGPCTAGTHQCKSDGTGWGPCTGQVLPESEVCATLEDDDCDGQVNEEGADCACVPYSYDECYEGPAATKDVGQCKAGWKECSGDGLSWGPCTDQVLPGVEDCGNNEDDDCDGQVSEEGPSCVCFFGDTQPCYTGPAGTQNVGVCVGGTQSCWSHGLGYGPCVGEVLPAAENCAEPEDEDCDGSAAPSCSPATWAKQYAPGNRPYVASGTSGDVTVAVTASSSIDFGGGALNGEVSDITAARFTSSGSHVWSRRFAGIGYENVRDVAVDASGNAVVVGDCQGYFTVDAQSYTCDQANDAFVIRLDPSGNVAWSGVYGDDWRQEAHAVAMDASGNAYVGGRFSGTLSFGGAAVVSSPVNANNLFVAKLAPGGSQQWLRGFSSSGAVASVAGLAPAPGGELAITGHFSGSMDLGGGPLTAGSSSRMFVARFDSSGQHLWSLAASSPGFAVGIATDALGNAIALGSSTSTVAFGPVQAAGTGRFVVRFDATGAPTWIQRFPGAAESIAASSNGELTLAGGFAGTIDFGFGAKTANGTKDAFVLRTDAGAQPLWARTFGGPGEDRAWDVSLDPFGYASVAGSFDGTVDLGGASLTSGGAVESFLVRYAP